jgi:hypothetical protein
VIEQFSLLAPFGHANTARRCRSMEERRKSDFRAVGAALSLAQISPRLTT